MRKIFGLLFIAFLVSCDSSDSSDMDCDCDSVVGKRWYWNIDRDIPSDCFYYEDFQLNEDGTIDVFRYSLESSDLRINNVGNWEFVSDCKLRISESNDSYPSIPQDCLSPVMFSIVDEGSDTNINNVTCSSFTALSITFTDVEP